MTVGQLIVALAAYDNDTPVALSKDPEANSISELAELSQEPENELEWKDDREGTHRPIVVLWGLD